MDLEGQLGKCQVILDGKPSRLRVSESVWHAFGLKRGKHTSRLVVMGEPYFVVIDDLVIFR